MVKKRNKKRKKLNYQQIVAGFLILIMIASFILTLIF